MRRVHQVILVILLLLSTVCFEAAQDRFDSEFETAAANAQTEEGTLYDRMLGEYMMSQPGIEEGMTKCLRENPGAQYVEGFFRFNRSGAYTLRLRPASEFASCLSSVWEGYEPPQPPALPYLNYFTFSFEE
jgi:hypothetical protein